MSDEIAILLDNGGTSSDPASPVSPIPHKSRPYRKKNGLTFDPKECPWQALRDVVFMKQQLGLKNLDICKVLKVRYESHPQIQIMVNTDVNKMNDWWHDPTRPNTHLPLNHGIKDYAELALSIKHDLRLPRPTLNIAPAPAPSAPRPKTSLKQIPRKRLLSANSSQIPSYMHIEDVFYPTGVSITSRSEFRSSPNTTISAACSPSQGHYMSPTELINQQISGGKPALQSKRIARGVPMQRKPTHEKQIYVHPLGQYPTSNTSFALLSTINDRLAAPKSFYRPKSNGLRSTSLEAKTEPRAPAHAMFASLTDIMPKREHGEISEEDVPFDPETCPWHALRDVSFARDNTDLTTLQISIILRYRYGAEFPQLRTVTPKDVVKMDHHCIKSGNELYERSRWGYQQIETKLREDLRAATQGQQMINTVINNELCEDAEARAC